jgi:hypothetical protein
VSPLGRCDRWYDWVIDVETGGIIQTYQFTAAPTFINDVVLTPTVAWFTDSQQAQLYGVPRGPGGTPGDPDDVITLPLTGDWVQQAGFNANGIAQTPNLRALLVVLLASFIESKVPVSSQAVPRGRTPTRSFPAAR